MTTARPDGGTQAAHLRLTRGPTPAKYTFTLAFWAKVVGESGLYLGPRFITTDDAGLRRDVIIDFANGKTLFGVFDDGCEAGTVCASLGDGQSAIDEKWHRYVLTGVVHPPDKADHGTVSLTVDGIPALGAKLTYPMASAIEHGLEFGLTYASTNVSGTVTYDDVVFQLTQAP